jgi:hypothetical protein
MKTRKTLVAGLFLAAMPLIATGFRPSRSQMVDSVAAASRTFRVPAGKYTAIVVSSIGTPNMLSAEVTVRSHGEKYAVAAEPGKTLLLTFADGWELREGEATVEISTTPANAPPGVVVAPASAWGITASKPVQFPER